jgi:hypothetical protein
MLLFSVFIFSGCDKLASPQEQPQRQKGAMMSTDDILATINDKIPEYGGSYIDENGQLNILVTDKTNKSAQAQEALKTDITQALMEVEQKYGGSPQNISKAGRATLKEAKYSFKQLNEWKSMITVAGLGLHGMNSVWIDDRIGIVKIAADNNREATLRFLTEEIEVPNDAFMLRMTGNKSTTNNPPENKTTEAECLFLSVESNMLECKQGKMVGGVRIYSNARGYAGCTLGLNVLMNNGKRGFITASHCGKSFAADDVNSIYSHRGGSGNSYWDNIFEIGKEVLDFNYIDLPNDNSLTWSAVNHRTFNLCRQWVNHPNGRNLNKKCRFTDVSLIEYNQNVPAGKILVGKLPEMKDLAVYEKNITDIQGLTITHSFSGIIPSYNKIFQIIGSYSGKHYEYRFIGGDTDHCADVSSNDNSLLLCQLRLQAPDYKNAGSGDSGGPVFASDNGNFDKLVTFYGLYVASDLLAGKNYGYVSQARYIFGKGDKNQPVTCIVGESELCNSPYGNLEFRDPCARVGGSGCIPTTAPRDPIIHIINWPTTTTFGYNPSVSSDVLAKPNYIARTYGTVWNQAASMHYLILSGEDRNIATDGSIRSANVQNIVIPESPHLVAKYDAKCAGLSNQGVVIVDCWDKRYISVFDVPSTVKPLLKVVHTRFAFPQQYTLSLTQGERIWDSSYIFKDPKSAPYHVYTFRHDNRLIISGVNYPILIDKNALNLLYAAYQAPKPPAPVCKDVTNCNPPKPVVEREEVKL